MCVYVVTHLYVVAFIAWPIYYSCDVNGIWRPCRMQMLQSFQSIYIPSLVLCLTNLLPFLNSFIIDSWVGASRWLIRGHRIMLLIMCSDMLNRLDSSKARCSLITSFLITSIGGLGKTYYDRSREIVTGRSSCRFRQPEICSIVRQVALIYFFPLWFFN